MSSPFLTARWQDLLLRNYECPRELLDPLVPTGTELDPWDGRHLISLVGFRFLDTRVKGFPIPGHRDFTEVNLRFYVRRDLPNGEERRGVVFIREVVPRRAIAWTARLLYNEPYATAEMSHEVHLDPDAGGVLAYAWTVGPETHRLGVRVDGPAALLAPGSEAEFITEHHWGYTRQRNGRTLEYHVARPPWRVWEGREGTYETTPRAVLYGSPFAEVLSGPPRSCFVAEGGPVEVYPGNPLG